MRAPAPWVQSIHEKWRNLTDEQARSSLYVPVGGRPSRFGDATGWCKELKALPILNLSVTLSLLFHKVFNTPVEKQL